MKNIGLLLIVAGVFVILAGIAIYGYVEVGKLNAAPADVAAQAQAMGGNALSFDAAYDSGIYSFSAKSQFEHFLLRYRLIFAVAAAVFLAGGGALCAVSALKKKHA